MALKQALKESEARIINYLARVPNHLKSASTISHKLRMGYTYMIVILQSMIAKGWLLKHKVQRNMFYDLTESAPLDEAIEALRNDGLMCCILEAIAKERKEIAEALPHIPDTPPLEAK